jgi:hypothetical protein
MSSRTLKEDLNCLSSIHDDIYIACPQFVMRLNCEISLIVLKLESLSLF